MDGVTIITDSTAAPGPVPGHTALAGSGRGPAGLRTGTQVHLVVKRMLQGTGTYRHGSPPADRAPSRDIFKPLHLHPVIVDNLLHLGITELFPPLVLSAVTEKGIRDLMLFHEAALLFLGPELIEG